MKPVPVSVQGSLTRAPVKPRGRAILPLGTRSNPFIVLGQRAPPVRGNVGTSPMAGGIQVFIKRMNIRWCV